MKVAFVFDNRPRPETTGFYCVRAMSALADVEHLLPEELHTVPPGLFDLFVFVDDGLDYELPAELRPAASWAIDTHLNLDRACTRFGDCDFVFAAQKNGASRMAERLGRPVQWLPLACDPEFHRPVATDPDGVDIAFVGNTLGGERARLLKALEDRYPNSRFCRAIFDEMAAVYSAARVGFNCSILDDLNMRLFEIPAHGTPLITNQISDNGLAELFEPGKHLLTYSTDDELFAAIERLLNDDDLRSRIGAAGREHVVRHHTYRHRMQQILDEVESASKSVAISKSFDYFEFSRPDVQALIPEDAYRILDVGCGAGALGADLKRHRDVHVTGIELTSAAAQRASRRLDRVINKAIEEISDTEVGAPFDCIVLADVLEHLRDPASALKRCRSWLTEHGSLVVSIPNSRHHSVISGLINGNWTYERAGLLDEDHVRCFTRREIEKLLFRSGFDVHAINAVPGPGYRQWQEAGCPGEVRIGKLQVGGLSSTEAEEFFTYQYLLRGQPRITPDYGLTSIVIVTWNQLAYTRECVDSILTRTDGAYELIFVDNGSTDGTPDYLSSIPEATVIRNSENRGYAPAVNQGIQVATGTNILLLNNDCVVTTGWLHGLLEALHDDDRNGLVGPVSNNVSGEQQVPVTYQDLASLDGFAWDRRSERNLHLTDRLVGFCLLIRRSVLDHIGLLDEQFEVGCFEDDDLCRRAIDAGYRALIARHVFVHHYGSVTFRGAGLDFQQIMADNAQRYAGKWNTNEGDVAASPPTLSSATYRAERLPNGKELLRREQIRLSLCMIVRDNEDTIEACLDSIYPWVDEIVVVDTGSVDRTPDICQRFGARMFEFPWCDDFSAARNVSIEHATGDWVFWMDSDDVIDQEQGRQLRELIYGNHADGCLGYVMQVHCPSSQAGQMTIVDHVKVFRNQPELRFEHRIHEQILPAIRRLGGDVQFTDLHVVHHGSDQTREVRARKLERDFRILKLDLAERPDHPFVLFNLGMTYDDAGQYEEAEQCLRRCIEVSTEGESHLRKAWALLLNTLKSQGKLDVAIEMANEAIATFSDDAELRFRRAVLRQDGGQLDDAIEDYQWILSESEERVFRSTDPAIRGHKALHNVALIHQELGQIEDALKCWESAVTRCPAFRPGWLGLARLHLREQRLTELQHLQTSVPDDEALTAVRSILAGFVAELQGDVAGAKIVLLDGFRESGDPECLNELSRLLVERGLMDEALPVLEELNQQQPGDAAVLHNLGNTLLAVGDLSRGAAMLEQSLAIRPESPATEALLRSVLPGVAKGSRP